MKRTRTVDRRRSTAKRKTRGAVHIAAGRWKRRRLEVPPGARPTGGRAREALFDILQKRVPGSRVLDLYAGSGAVGLEAVSRGAARAVLVEKHCAAIRRNLERLGPGAEVELLPLEAGQALVLLAARGERFNIVFADPPYDPRATADPLRGVAPMLEEGGTFVLQADSGREAPPVPETLRLSGRRPYGRNVFWFFRREG
ncbi:MAG: 16S rRNA (guanine(966)-N(2))-methyltransferase RsmD [Thermoanaerobaculia bacterium]